MTIPPPIVLTPDEADAEHQLALLPRSPGIYTLSFGGSPAHVSWCSSLPARLRRLIRRTTEETPGTMQTIRQRLTRIESWPTGSRLENLLLMYAITKSLFPEDYAHRLRLRLPWFIGLTAADAFPRLTLSNRLRRGNNFFGPFASRELAQVYEEQIEGLFQIRRCTETLSPHSEHPGCIYGEMGHCLRPCQLAVAPGEYGTEAARVEEFLSSNGRGLLSTLAAARDAATEALEFEQAAFLHKRMERVQGAIAARDEVIADAAHFNGVALTCGTQPGQLCLWPMQESLWQTPLRMDLSPERPELKSLDQLVREILTAAGREVSREGKRVEHLALFLRWHRSSWRDGEWFPYRTLGDLNYRKLVREMSKLVKSGPQSC